MKRTITLLVLLVTSQFAAASHTLSTAEVTCVAISTYHEGRSLTPLHWRKIANVAYNRSIAFGSKFGNESSRHFGARSSNLCDIVKSKEYASHASLRKKRLEPEVYSSILIFLQTIDWKHSTTALFFETPQGRIRYTTTWNKHL